MAADLTARAARAAAAARRAGQMADTARQAAAAWRDPVARLLRRRRRARWGLGLRTAFAIGISIVAGWAIIQGDVVGGAFLAVVGAFAIYSVVPAVRRVWVLERTPLPAPPPPPPPHGSAARVPMERLSARERTLANLFVLLGPSGRDAAGEAAAAATALRARGERVVVLEAARRDAPPQAVGDLDEALGVLCVSLEDGVDAYDRLVTAAAGVVSASIDDRSDSLTAQRLSETTDALAGLARGLREVSGR
jgi:hypothetical protein